MPPASIHLRRLTTGDYPIVLNWSKDDAFCSANGWAKDRSPEELCKWWNQCIHTAADDFVRLGIERNKQLIGYADLACIQNHAAELGIAIGESSLWGKGIGYQSALCMIEYGVKTYGISMFYAETHETNIRSRKMLERLGFEETGRHGSEVYLGQNARLIQYRLDRSLDDGKD